MDKEIIRSEADNFILSSEFGQYRMRTNGAKEFQYDLECELSRFDEDIHKLIFIYRVLETTNKASENDYKRTKERDVFFKTCIFYIEQEIRKLNPDYEFKIFRPHINSDLLKENLVNLKNYQEVGKLYQSALDKLNMQQFERNLLDDLRLSIELLFKAIFKNNKSIENQNAELGNFLRERKTSKQISNMFIKLLDYFAKYHNDYIKHNDNVNKEEVDLIVNLSSAFIQFIISK